MIITYRLAIDVGAIAGGILQHNDHPSLLIELAHYLAVLPRQSGVVHLSVIIGHAAHREDLIEDLDTLHLPRDAVEFRPDLPREGLRGIRVLLWVNSLEFQLGRVSQFLVYKLLMGRVEYYR